MKCASAKGLLSPACVLVLGLCTLAYVCFMIKNVHLKSSMPLGPCSAMSSPQINVVLTWVNVSEPEWATSALSAVIVRSLSPYRHFLLSADIASC